jgi:hypothetical protein
MSDAPRELSLLDSLRGEWLKLPLAAMRDVGPAVQTLGAILRITARETYVPTSHIAAHARLPIATVRKHIPILHVHGWISSRGRQPTRRGWLRRTCTIAVTKKTLAALEPSKENPITYGFLPWWACCSISKIGRLPWCARAVLSVVMGRLAGLKAAVDAHDGEGLDADDAEGVIEDIMGGDERFRFSLRWLTERTGLDHKSIIKAKGVLNHRIHVVRWQGTPEARKGQVIDTDLLIPNWNFRAIVTPVSDTRCRVGFRG